MHGMHVYLWYMYHRNLDSMDLIIGGLASLAQLKKIIVTHTISLYKKFQKANVNIFVFSILITANPHLNGIRGGGWEGKTEPRRRVEGAAGSHAVLSIPKCPIVFTITEIVITNKFRRQGSKISIRIVTWATIAVASMACTQAPDMLTW